MSGSAAPGEQASGPRVIVLGPGEGRIIPGPEGLTLKASSEETGGSIGVLEGTSPAGFGAPRHIHHRADELFYVLGGEFLFLVGQRFVSAPPGTFVFIPRGTVHAAKCLGPEPGRVLAAFIPGGVERAFEEFAELARRQGSALARSGVEARAIRDKYHSEVVGPPL